mgnify:CR=1 FL=1
MLYRCAVCSQFTPASAGPKPGFSVRYFGRQHCRALLRNSRLRREVPFPCRSHATRTISAVPRAEKRFMRATLPGSLASSMTPGATPTNLVRDFARLCLHRHPQPSHRRSSVSKTTRKEGSIDVSRRWSEPFAAIDRLTALLAARQTRGRRRLRQFLSSA